MALGLKLYDWLKKDCPLEIPVMIERIVPHEYEKDGKINVEKELDIICGALLRAIEYYRNVCKCDNHIIQPYDNLLKMNPDAGVFDYKGNRFLIAFEKGHLWGGALVKLIKGEGI